MKKTLFSLSLAALSFFCSADSAEAITCTELRRGIEKDAELSTQIDDDGDLKISFPDWVIYVMAKSSNSERLRFSDSSREIKNIQVYLHYGKPIESEKKRERIIRDFNKRSIFRMVKIGESGIAMTAYLSELNQATDSYVKKATICLINSLSSSMVLITQEEL